MVLAFCAGVAVVPARAQEGGEVSGYVAADLRVFPQPALHPGQKDQHLNPSLVLRPEFYYEWNQGDDLVTAVPFARLDAQDSESTHADLRELNYQHVGDGWDVTVGLDKVFWGVTESRHLADIVNQTDAVEDIDGEDKLGQPMFNLGLQHDWGDMNLFVMPYFRERTFPGRDGRLRGAKAVDTDRAIYESDLGRRNPDAALRYATVLGDWDLGLAHFHGTSREPRLVAGTDKSGRDVWVPHYDLIDQSSIDVQATIEEWLWKLEAIYRTGQGDGFLATSLGLEYSFFGVVGEAGDLGLLAEYHYDGRGETAPGTMFDNDLFLGLRVTLNDVNGTDFLAGVLIDRITRARILTVEADTRLTDRWTVEGELRLTDALATKDPLYGARRDKHLQVRLTYFF